jgi:hypothetical protein
MHQIGIASKEYVSDIDIAKGICIRTVASKEYASDNG